MAGKEQEVLPITPERVGSTRKAIFPGLVPQQVAFASALASSDPDSGGYTLNEARVRTIAAGAPIWDKMYGRTDYHWMAGREPGARARVNGYVFEFTHTEPKGKKSVGEGGAPVDGKRQRKLTRLSMGDDERRWLYAGDGVEPLPKNCRSRAKQRMEQVVAELREAGFSNAEMLATPFLAWCEAEFSLGLETTDAAKPKRRRRRAPAKSAKSEQPAEPVVDDGPAAELTAAEAVLA